MDATILLLPGDGVGPEVVSSAQQVLEAVAAEAGHTFRFRDARIGGTAIDEEGDPLPPDTMAACLQADAVLLGAVGGPRWADPTRPVRPEQGLLRLREVLGTFANLRPVRAYPGLEDASALRPDRLDGVDLMIVRELTGGIYFGTREEASTDSKTAFDTMAYSEPEVERLAHVAFRLARSRRRRVISVDKANVLASSRLWRRVVTQVAREYPDVAFESMLVDAAAMHLLRCPRDFDVLVTGNLFGDILADEASMLAGSMGLLPSASLAGLPEPSSNGPPVRGLYEPVHGSAPDIAGKGIANPLGAILSAAMLLRHSLGLAREADGIEDAVAQVLADGVRTPDLSPGSETGTAAMTRAVVEALDAGAAKTLRSEAKAHA